MTPIKAYIGVIIAFLLLDALWLGLFAKSLYQRQLGEWMRDDPNLIAAAAFYAVYAIGIVYFAVLPALLTGAWWTAALKGALLGVIAYGTYAMTNYAVFKGWSLNLALIDTLWGAVLTAVAAAAGFLATYIKT